LSRDNPVASWYTGIWTWKKIKDDKVGNKELLVAWSDKRCREIYRQLWYIKEWRIGQRYKWESSSWVRY